MLCAKFVMDLNSSKLLELVMGGKKGTGLFQQVKVNDRAQCHRSLLAPSSHSTEKQKHFKRCHSSIIKDKLNAEKLKLFTGAA